VVIVGVDQRAVYVEQCGRHRKLSTPDLAVVREGRG
jgi:hypothetical protein